MNNSQFPVRAGRVKTGTALLMLAAAMASGTALAGDNHYRGGWRGDDNAYRHDRGTRQWRHERPRFVVNQYYPRAQPLVIYRERPVVIERVVERVVVQQPSYPVYAAPAPVYAAPAAVYGGAYYGAPNRVVTAAVLGAAGGLLGSQVGRGDGRVAATAAGAVAGWVLGSNLGR